MNHSPSCDVDSVELYAFQFLLKAFIFLSFFYMGAGWGYCMKWGWWLYIFMFLYHKIIWIISTLRSKHVYFDKTIQTYWALWSCKNKKNFCNTKTLNLSEHRSVSVCAPLPPFVILFLSLASSAAFNKSLVCSFYHLASFGFCLFLSVLWNCCFVTVNIL